MQDKICLHFGDSPIRHSFSKLRHQRYSFEEFPGGTEDLFLDGRPWSNCDETGIRFRVSFETVKQWGSKRDDLSALYFVAKSASGTRFHVKMVLNVGEIERNSKRVAEGYSAWSEAEVAYQNLVGDALFYGQHVHRSGLEGILIPKHYGLWEGRAENGGRIVVNICEWAGLSWSMISSGHAAYKQYNTTQNRLLVGRTIELLHDSGIVHGRLGGFIGDQRHVLLDLAPLSKEDRKLGKARCMISDFSSAYLHHCRRQIPLLELDVRSKTDLGCDEISNVAWTLDLFEKKEFIDSEPERSRTKTHRAIKWLEEYSQLYPDLSDMDRRAAQRYLFFGEQPIHKTVIISLSKERKSTDGSEMNKRVFVRWPTFISKPTSSLVVPDIPF